MSLEGNLKDISLEHIFEIINSGKKTGSLHIVRGEGDIEAFIYFRQGKIFGAVSNFNRVPIGERLVSACYITAEDLAKALEVQKQDKKPRKLGQILLAEELITPDALKRIVKEQIQSTVFDILSWTDGEFQFSVKLPPVEDIGLLVNAKNVILEGGKRMEEWKRLRKKVPSPNTVFVINDKAPRQVDITLSPRHWQMLRIIDGNRSVDDLVKLEQISEFETCSILADLVNVSLIKIFDQKTTDSKTGETAATATEKVKAVAETGATVTEIKEDTDKANEPAAAEDEEIDFQSVINLNKLDEIVPNELLTYRSAFMKELGSLTEGDKIKPIKEIISLSSIKRGKKINDRAIKDAIEKFK